MTIINGQVANADEVIKMSGAPDAQNANRILKADTSVFTNEGYSGADDFTDSNGVMNTVDLTNTTAYYNSTSDYYESVVNLDNAVLNTYDPDGVTDPENFFDDNAGTYATETLSVQTPSVHWDLGKTWATGNKRIKWVEVKADVSLSSGAGGTGRTCSIKLYTYNGSTWDEIATLASDSAGSGEAIAAAYDDVYELDADVEGVGILISASGTSTGTCTATGKWYSQELWDVDGAVVETDSIISDVVPKSIVVYGEKTLPANTSITIDVSDDGGTTFAVTGGAFNTPIDTTTLSGSDIALKFNLDTTDTSATAKLYGYGVVITNS